MNLRRTPTGARPCPICEQWMHPGTPHDCSRLPGEAPSADLWRIISGLAVGVLLLAQEAVERALLKLRG